MQGSVLGPERRSVHRAPSLSRVPVGSIRPDEVRVWYAGLDAGTPTARSHAYSLLRTICNTAVHDDLLAANPCRIRAAGASKRIKEPQPATVAELETITEAMP